MSSALRFIALSVLLTFTFGQNPEVVTFTNPTSLNAQSTVVPARQGYLVTIRSAGWTYGNPIELNYPAQTVTYTTLLRSTGVTGVGPIGATCGTNYNAVNQPSASFVGLAATNPCPVDVATLYTITATTPNRPTGTSSSDDLIGSVLTVGAPVRWTFTPPAQTVINNVEQVIGINVQNDITVPFTSLDASVAGPVQTGALGTQGAQQYALAGIEYAFYVETTGSAQVCFQSELQYEVSPSDCGEQLYVYGRSDQSAGILSTSITVVFALVALIFFN